MKGSDMPDTGFGARGLGWHAMAGTGTPRPSIEEEE